MVMVANQPPYVVCIGKPRFQSFKVAKFQRKAARLIETLKLFETLKPSFPIAIPVHPISGEVGG